MKKPEYIEQAIARALKESPDVSVICDGRIFPIKIPQNTVLPTAIYQRIHSSPDHTLLGYSSEAVTVIVNSFSVSYIEAKDLALAIRGAMAAAPVNGILQNEIDLHEDDSDVYCISAEYLCQQSGGYCHG